VQYKTKFTAWKFQKNIPKEKTLPILKKQDQRWSEGKETYFMFKGQPINHKLDRARKRFETELAAYTLSPTACKLFEFEQILFD